MSEPIDPAITVAISEVLTDLDRVRRTLTTKKVQTAGSRWRACVKELVKLETSWREQGWISAGGFKHSLVLAAHLRAKHVVPSATAASLLLALVAKIQTRQHKSNWARALQEVLDGHLTATRASELGVNGSLKQAIDRRKQELKREKRRQKSPPKSTTRLIVPRARPNRI